MQAHLGKLTYCSRNPGASQEAEAFHIEDLSSKLGSSGEGDFSDRKLSVLHTGASQCSPEGRSLNLCTHQWPLELTQAYSVKVEKEVNNKKKKKEREKRETYSQSHYEQFSDISAPCPVGGRSLGKTGLCEGDGRLDAAILLCHSINQRYILTLNTAAKAEVSN